MARFRHITILLLLTLNLPGSDAGAQSASVLLQEGLHAEQMEGDLDAAIKVYERVLKDFPKKRAQAAQALLRIGLCYEKLGKQKAQEAQEAYQRVIKEFADQAEPVRVAREHLEQLDGGAPGQVEDRLLWTTQTSMMVPSPDGHTLAFRDEKTLDLVVRELETGKNRRLTHNTVIFEGKVKAACFSSDGKWITYNWVDKEGRGDLRIIGVDGSQARTVRHPDEQVTDIQPKAWFLDGKRILARRSLQDGTRQIVIVSVADGALKVLKSLRSNDGEHLSPSPDGRYIAYDFRANERSGQQDISILPVHGGPELRVIEHPADDHVLGWAPDGRTLLFCSDRRAQGNDAWLIQIADGKPQGLPQLVEKRIAGAGTISGGQFAPDGSFYYAVATEKWGEVVPADVYTFMLDSDAGKVSTAPKPLAERPDQRVTSPAFSPNGKYLAYYVAPIPEQLPEGQWRRGPGSIVIRSLETGQERELTLSPKFSDMELSTHMSPLRWAPDGRSLLILGWIETGHLGIYRVNIDTGKLNPVVLADPEPTMSTNWQDWVWPDPTVKHDWISYGELSPDGNTLFYTRSHFNPDAPPRFTGCRLLARDLGTGREREVYRIPDEIPTFMFFFAVSPDGQHVVVPGPTALQILPSAGGEPRELLKFEGRFRWNNAECRTMAWTPDSRHLLFVRPDNGRYGLWRIATAGGQPERVGELPPDLGNWFGTWIGHWWRLRIHPDGRQIAFTIMSWRQDRELRVLENFLPDLSLPQTLTGADDPQRPFGLDVEVPDPEGDDVKEFAATVKLSGDDDDLNAPQWCDKVHQGKRGSLDGLWESRLAAHGRFFRGIAQVTTVGDWIYILNNNGPGYYWLFKTRRQGNRLAGRFINSDVLHYDQSTGPWVGLIVNDERIDGVTSDSEGWDLRRNLLPSVELSSPASDDYVAVGEPVLLKADVAIDQDVTVGRVEFLIDGVPVGEVTDPPYQLNWEAAKQGSYSAAAKVYDSVGGTERSLPVEVFVGIRALNRFVAHSLDDAQENAETGSMYLDNSQLKLINGNRIQIFGVRFGKIGIPKGTFIKKAYLQFTTAEVSTEQTDLVIHAERAANAQPFAAIERNITSRRKTATSIKWSPEPWKVEGERSEKQQTPDLSPLIREVLAQPDWQEGNAVVLIMSGSGERGAMSYDGTDGFRQYAPMLYIEY